MQNHEANNIMLLMDSDDHESVCLGFQIMEALNLSKEVMSKYTNLEHVEIEKKENLLLATGDINRKLAKLLSKLSLNIVANFPEKISDKVAKYTRNFLGMLVESTKNLKKNHINFDLRVEADFIKIFVSCTFKKNDEIEKRKSIIEKIPTMKAYKADNVICDMTLINDTEYNFKFTAAIPLHQF